MDTRCWDFFIIILEVSLSGVSSQTCLLDADNKSYCDEVRYHCCEDNTKCCREDYQAFRIIAIVIAVIISFPVLIIGIGFLVTSLKEFLKKANENKREQASSPNRHTVLATQY